MSDSDTKKPVLYFDQNTYDYVSQENVCRLCCSTNGVIEIASYSPPSIENDATMAQKILECVCIDVTTQFTHNFPKKICFKCYNKVEMFTEFKRLCKETDSKLHRILNSSRDIIQTVKIEYEENVDPELNIETELVHKIKLLEAKFEENLDNAMDLNKEYKYSMEPEDFDNLCVGFTKNEVSNEIGGNFREKRKGKCSICDLDFYSLEKLTDHNIKWHSSKENAFFKCTACGKRYQDLKHGRSGRRCHSCMALLENVYKCRKCFKVFETSECLQEHKEQNHMRSCVCEICGKVYSCPGNLNIHKRMHDDVKHFKCPHCDYRSTQPSCLVVHIRKHTGERPYACDMCPQRCINSSNLKKHKKIHLNIKDFECNICKRRFPLKQTLNEHVSTVHLKEKNHVCPLCGIHYSRIRNLRQHMLVKHGQKARQCGGKISDLEEESYWLRNTDGAN